MQTDQFRPTAVLVRLQKKAPPLETSGGVLATSYSRTAYRRTLGGAAAFHCRVRNGNGWGHCAIVTRVRCRTGGIAASQRDKPMSISGDRVRRGGRPTISRRGQRPRLQYFQKNMIFN